MKRLVTICSNIYVSRYVSAEFSLAIGQWVTTCRRDVDLSRVPSDSGIRNLPSISGLGPDIAKAGTSYLPQTASQKDKKRRIEELDEYRARKGFSKSNPNVEKADSINISSSTNGSDEIYSPLTDPQEIRVLELAPGKFGDDLRGRLHTCLVDIEYSKTWDRSLAYIPKTLHAVSQNTGQSVWFTALSYVWGDIVFAIPIFINGKQFLTTPNLNDALRHLRQEDIAIILWVDQLCINQNDLEEKSQQVLLMSKIYFRAWTTIVWLGKEDDHSNEAIDLVLGIGEKLQYYMREGTPSVDEIERMSLPRPGFPQWAVLRQLLRRPWFRRIWVIQEVVISYDVTFQCGFKNFSWGDLTMFVRCMIEQDLIQYLGTPEDVGPGYQHVDHIARMKTYHESFQHQPDLLTVLVDGRTALATDSRDKVFAVMGMSATQICPDYTKKISDLYLEVAQVNAQNDVINLLCCVDHPYDVPAELPSWVPDWSMIRDSTSLAYHGQGSGIYQAARSNEVVETLGRDKTLELPGIFVDSIRSVKETVDPDLEELIRNKGSTNDLVSASIDLVLGNCQSYPSGCRLLDAFWQTLVAGKDYTGLRKPPQEYSQIFALLLDTCTGRAPSFPDQPIFKRRLTINNLKFRQPSRTYREVQQAFNSALKGRRIGITEKKYVGLFPKTANVGDRICVFKGGWVPFLVRQNKDDANCRLVGECYLHGIMNGEVMVSPEWQKVVLI